MIGVVKEGRYRLFLTIVVIDSDHVVVAVVVVVRIIVLGFAGNVVVVFVG